MAGALAAMVGSQLTFGASANWTGGTNGIWEAAGTENNWSSGPGTFPGDLSGGTTNVDIANFLSTQANSNVTINSTAGNTTPLNLGGIFYQQAALGSYTIGGN